MARYTDEKHALIVLALLKKHGIRKVIASPGTTNIALVASMQGDPDFEMHSAPDERSAAYIACGLSAESKQPVVLTCTGATASLNYLPGLTEAFYRKLPVLAITSTQPTSRVGHHVAQVIDRSVLPRDAIKLSLNLPIVKDADDYWECEVKVNRAILELSRRGGGPVHLNLPTVYSDSFALGELPDIRQIRRFTLEDSLPRLPVGKVAIFVGSHRGMSAKDVAAIDEFCTANDAVVFCDHTSSYRGKYRLIYSLVAGQKVDLAAHQPDLLIHIGEVTGDYYSMKLCGKEVWRVNPDGEVRDTFRKLTAVFEMPEAAFFQHYAKRAQSAGSQYQAFCARQLELIYNEVPDLPFSNPWIAQRMAPLLPPGSMIHFGILNSLRAWNFFELPESVESASNVGGFGIDGCVSSLLGASLANPKRIYFGVIGDLATFYDLNALGNRHLGSNFRLLLVNNGRGTEFRQSVHRAAQFGESADTYIAAAGHYGNKSRLLMKHYSEDLGFEYCSAASKSEFEAVYKRFVTPTLTDRPMLFEVFTDTQDESDALEQLLGIWREVASPDSVDGISRLKQFAKQAVGGRGVRILKAIAGKE